MKNKNNNISIYDNPKHIIRDVGEVGKSELCIVNQKTNNMEEQLISLKTAKLAKENGFNIKCRYFYNNDSELECVDSYVGDSIEESREFIEHLIQCEAPTQSLLQKWLREQHQIFLNSISGHGYGFGARFEVTWRSGFDYDISYTDIFKTYEEALERGLQEALKLIKNK